MTLLKTMFSGTTIRAAYVELSTRQASPAAGGRVLFDTLTQSASTGLSLSSNRVVVPAGTWVILLTVTYTGSASSLHFADIAWYDFTNSAYLPNQNTAKVMNKGYWEASGVGTYFPSSSAWHTFTASTTIEARIQAASGTGSFWEDRTGALFIRVGD